MNSTKPSINVTPLIDVLLVLLIIFMVISPIKPTDFKAKIPQESKQEGKPNPKYFNYCNEFRFYHLD